MVLSTVKKNNEMNITIIISTVSFGNCFSFLSSTGVSLLCGEAGNLSLILCQEIRKYGP